MAVQTDYIIVQTVAIEGALADNSDHDVVPMYNGEASAEIAFGRAVAYARAGDGSDNAALLPLAANTPLCAGITLHIDQYTAADLGTTGVKIGGQLSVLRRGRVWAKCLTACQPGDRLFVQKTVNGGTRPLGVCDNAVDGSNSIDLTKVGEWRTTASAGGLAILEVDFTTKP